jgi:cytochrome c2
MRKPSKFGGVFLIFSGASNGRANEADSGLTPAAVCSLFVLHGQAATFEEYIKDPKAKIPGTKMVFAGIKNEQAAKDLWAYLKQFDAQGNLKK